MGADIHVYIERYNKESKRWDSLNLYKKDQDDTYEPILIYDGRNYELFGLLAGVRGSSFLFRGGYGYIVEPRGLPENLSSYVQLKWEKGKDENGRQYWHTPTWYDFCELDTYSYLLNDINKTIKNKNKIIEDLEREIEKSNNNEILDDEFECLYDLYNNNEYDDEDDYNGIDALQRFVEDIRRVLDEYGIYNPKFSQVRIVIWFDN